MANLRVLALIPFMFVCGVANATLITFDAYDYAAGTNLTDLSPGLHLQMIASPAGGPVQIGSYDVRSAHNPGGMTAPGFFAGIGSPFGGALTAIDTGYGCYAASQAGQPTSSFCNEGFSFLELTFDVATDFVEIVGGFGDSLGGTLYAFDSAGQLLGTAGVSSIRGEGQFASSLTLAQAAITRVVYGASLDAGAIAAGSISYNSYNIPEPETMLLMLTGLSGLLIAGRRRKKLATAN